MSVPRLWRLNRQRYRMTGTRCPHCGKQCLSPRLVCPTCHSIIEDLVQRVFPAFTESCSAEQRAETASVLIPSCNHASTIRTTLSSLLSQDLGEPYEIIVVDSSTDGTARIVSTEFPSVHLVCLRQPIDPGAARNIGLARARGEVIACIDADCVVPPDWLRKMVTAHRAGHQVVGGTIENGSPGSVIAWASYWGEFRDWLPVVEAHLVGHVPTCNISYDRSIFARFGGFPTGFYPQEDLLYHWHLSRRGVPVWFDPAICVRRALHTTLCAYMQHWRRSGRSTARVLKLTNGDGVFLARYPVLAVLAAPVLPLVKWLRTIFVFVSRQPEVLQKHGIALVPLLLGLYVWVAGFVDGAWAPPLRVSEQEVLWQAQ